MRNFQALIVISQPIRKLLTTLSLVCTLSLGSLSIAQEPVRIAFMDPLSGTFASIGNTGLKILQFSADYYYNSRGGILGGRMIEIVPLDNKQSPNETQLQFRRAVSDDIQIIFQGNSSAVANTLNQTISRHNRRNPGQEVLQINYSAVDPILTEDNCSFWHFRFDAHANMKLNILTDYIAADPDIKSMYIIGQDYSFGQVVSDTSIELLKQKRPDIEIVGNEFHPIGQVKDFTPYVTKIVSSGADAVMIGRGAQGQPWLPGQIGRRLQGGAEEATPSLETQLHYVRTLYDGVCALYGLRIGLKHARKHLGWALDVAAQASRAPAEKLKSWRRKILISEDPRLVHSSLQDAFDDFAWSAAA